MNMQEYDRYKIIELDDSSWRIEDDFVRFFLFEGNDKALLVDCGLGNGDLKGLVRSLTDKPVTLLISHADHDHTGGSRQFQKILVHDKEIPRYKADMGEDICFGTVSEGDVIDLGTRCFEILWIPGHTPGGIALLDRKNRILVAGDNVQNGTVFMTGEGRDMHLYIEGLKKLNQYRDAFDVIYPSHGGFPVEPGLIDLLIEGTERILRGEVPGEPAFPPFDKTAKLYNIGAATIMC